ncbi:MAG TPA: FAD-dependent oxidoreductase [Bacillota bacterium]|nr:FAD-dependent oxidoreductase [Bacillota bacterium]
MTTNQTKLPKESVSYWRKNIDFPTFSSLQEDIQADVSIIGAGLTGITAAYLLAKEGKKVALIEADDILNGTTGHTTAKITAQHGVIYDELITHTGKNNARLYYEANKNALAFITDTINELGINCDYSKQDAYIYATTALAKDKIAKEAKAYKKLNIPGTEIDELPIPITIKNGLVMPDQAQFHPLKYANELINEVIRLGGTVYEQTTAVNVETGEKPTVLTRNNCRIQADYILQCTHFPFYEGLGLYSTRMYAERSYVLAAKTKEPYPGGMYISTDEDTRSLRPVRIDGEDMVLIVGAAHKTGQGKKDTMDYYKMLETFGEQTFGIESIPYRWSAQDLTSLDKLPYVGPLTSEQSNIMVATGYRKWGMTNSTAAAHVLTDMVMKRKNTFSQMYTPSRFHATPSIKTFLKENGNVAAQLIKGKLGTIRKDADDLAPDTGAVTMIDGQRKGIYKNGDGEVFLVDTTCTHVGCEVSWNQAEKTWDCPCHGSRFSYTGEVIEGPAEKPLKRYDYTMLDNLTSEDSGY